MSDELMTRLMDDRLTFAVEQQGAECWLAVNGQWAGAVIGPATGAIIAEWLTAHADDLMTALTSARKRQRQNWAIAGIIHGQKAANADA